MKKDAILIPSGRSTTLVDGGVDEDRGHRRRTSSAARVPPVGDGHRDRGRGHEEQDARGVGAALGVDVGLEEQVTTTVMAMKTRTSGRVARAQSGAMP